MSNKILTGPGWQGRVRDKIGVMDAYLSNDTIEQPDCITVAEANIIAQIPDYAAVSGDAKVYLEAAVVCECAVLLCPGMPARLPRQSLGPHAKHELSIDWDKKKEELQSERDGYVSKVLELAFPNTHFPFRPFFTVTCPPRRW